jgi:S-DNA-T family DNA segregation ATPase FtsK/SpoIIIE
MTETTMNGVHRPEAPGTPVPDGERVLRAVPEQGTVSLDKTDAPTAVDEAEEAPAVRLVDPPKLAGTGVYSEKRAPILPAWLRRRVDFVMTVKRTAARGLYAAGYHSVRLPWYAARLASMSPRGAARLCVATGRWVWDREAAPLRSAAVEAKDAEEYMRLAKLRGQRVRTRGILAALVLCFGAAFASAVYVLAPGWAYSLAVLGVLAIGYGGQHKDAPVVGPAVLRTEVPKLTSSVVLRGLNAIGNPKISAAIKKGGDMDGMKFVSEICRDGPGYRADLDLPYGTTPDDVMDKREALASGLRRKVGCVWPSGDPEEHEGRMVLWVGDRPMNEQKRPSWPLLKSGAVDLFKPVVFGNDQRMRPVSVTLMFASVVIGAVPRMGKTFLQRLLLLIAALDVRSELHVFDFKGTGDFGALEPVCHRYRAGDDDEDMEYVLHSMRELKQELRRRSKLVRSLPRNRCPESKVTPELASDKSLGLHPIVVAADECQVPFEHEEYGAELEEIATDITKRGPALGIVGMFSTQRPDAKSLPPGISSNAVLRFCLKVMGHQVNDMVLGTGMYKAGIRATMFSRQDRGICFMAGEGDDPQIVASAFVDAVGAEKVVARARTMREEYGNITGHALGQQPERLAGEFDQLRDILDVIPAAEEQVWNERIAARLAQQWPDRYTGWKGEQVTSALKPHGVKTGQVWGTSEDGKGGNRRGIKRADLAAVVTRRNAERASG